MPPEEFARVCLGACAVDTEAVHVLLAEAKRARSREAELEKELTFEKMRTHSYEVTLKEDVQQLRAQKEELEMEVQSFRGTYRTLGALQRTVSALCALVREESERADDLDEQLTSIWRRMSYGPP